MFSLLSLPNPSMAQSLPQLGSYYGYYGYYGFYGY